MANSKSQKKHWAIPRKYLKSLAARLKAYKGDKKAEGYTRLKNLISKGKVSYENLKFIKHTLEKNKSNEAIYNLNGGKEFERWINDTLSTARKSIENGKKIKKETGVGNAYIKNHEKDSSNGLQSRTPKLHKSMSVNDINNNNVNYESIRITKVIITESQLKNLVKENNKYYDQGLGVKTYVDKGGATIREIPAEIFDKYTKRFYYDKPNVVYDGNVSGWDLFFHTYEDKFYYHKEMILINPKTFTIKTKE